MRKIICAFLLISCSAIIFAGSSDVPDALTRGLEAYARSDWTGAVVALKKAVSDSDTASSESWYWLVMAEVASADYLSASRDADYFLSAWPKDIRYADMLYQKGRILFLSGKCNESIRVLSSFVSTFPEHPFVSAGYFWIGESLYSLGRFDEASVLYTKVVTDYALSVKREAANYRLAVIKQKDREEELLEILKWSHEESLKVVEEYQKREKSYEQALAAYQKRLSDIQRTGSDAGLEQELGRERLKNAELVQQNENLQKLNQDLIALSESKIQDAESNTSVQSTSEIESESSNSVRERLEQLRRRAVELEQSVKM